MADNIIVKAIDAPTLLAVLNNAASGVVGGVRSKGKFLQVGGLRYAYDMARLADARVVNAEVQLPSGAWAPLPGYAGPILLAADSFVAGGGNGYDVLEAVSIALGARARGLPPSPASALQVLPDASLRPVALTLPDPPWCTDEGAQTDITVGNWIAANSPLAVADGGSPSPIVDCAAAPADPLCSMPAPAPAQAAAAAVAVAAAAAPTIAPGVVAVVEQEDVALEQAAAAVSALATSVNASSTTLDTLAKLAQGLLGN